MLESMADKHDSNSPISGIFSCTGIDQSCRQCQVSSAISSLEGYSCLYCVIMNRLDEECMVIRCTPLMFWEER